MLRLNPLSFATLALVACVACAHAGIPATGSPGSTSVTGSWKLDLAQTKMWKKATRPLWRVDDIRLEGSDMYWSWHAEEPKGPWKARVHLATDGREMRNVIAGHPSKSRGMWRGDTLNFVTRGRAYFIPYRLEDHIWLSDGGRVMNVVRKFRMATLNEDEHWVFRRVEGDDPARASDTQLGGI